MTKIFFGGNIFYESTYITKCQVSEVGWNKKPHSEKERKMEVLNRKMTGKKDRPIKVVQFGEGNFLRAFVDYMIDIANEQGRFDGDIVLVKPINFGSLDSFHRQDCQYTVSLRGNVDGEGRVINRVVTSVADAVDCYSEYDKYMGLAELASLRFVVSNTTEAGIVFDDTDRDRKSVV